MCAGSGLSAANTHLALPPDFAKCGGSRRVVEAPPRWNILRAQRVREADALAGVLSKSGCHRLVGKEIEMVRRQTRFTVCKLWTSSSVQRE